MCCFNVPLCSIPIQFAKIVFLLHDIIGKNGINSRVPSWNSHFWMSYNGQSRSQSPLIDKHMKSLGGYECTWWRLFMKWVEHTKCGIYVFTRNHWLPSLLITTFVEWRCVCFTDVRLHVLNYLCRSSCTDYLWVPLSPSITRHKVVGFLEKAGHPSRAHEYTRGFLLGPVLLFFVVF